MKAYQYRMGEPIAALQIVDLIEQDATPPPRKLSTSMLTLGSEFHTKTRPISEAGDEPE
jgi:hypothetical protein